MKRVILAVVGTVAGVVALLSFKTASPQATAGPLPSAAASGASTPMASTPATTTPTSVPASASASASPSAPASSASKSFLGKAITTRYGVIQVKVTVAAGKITNVAFVQLQAFDNRSAQINSQAAPTLLQETLTAQSAQIDSVSGASYTSSGYVQSLQSALDSAGVR